MNKLYEIRKKAADYIKQNNMIDHGDVIVAGVSGGADSMCLLNLLLDLRNIWDIEVVAVHVHHGIRGQAADDDMEYVENFCRQQRIEFFGFHFDIPAIALENHLSCEEAGRIKRYEAFNQVYEKKAAEGRNCKIAVAHNMDDNSETFLFNLFRGTGIKGLAGIRPVRDHIIRPVLCLGRKEIVEYLTEKEIEYKTDATNLETDYTRNKIRLKLLPYIEENINEGARGNINRTAMMLTEINDYMEKQALASYNNNIHICMAKDDTCIQTDISGKLWDEADIIVKMVIRMAVEKTTGKLKDITSRHIESVAELGKNQVSRAVDLPYGIRAVRTYEGIRLEKRNKGNKTEKNLRMEKTTEKEKTEEAVYIEIRKDKMMDGQLSIELPEGIMTFSVEKNTLLDLSEKRYTKLMNCDILKDKLSVRHRKTGDYMIIDSEGRKKKLKDMLIDLKIPKEERDNVLLLAKEQEILWIVGYRMSERCKVQMNTSSDVYRVNFTPEHTEGIFL